MLFIAAGNVRALICGTACLRSAFVVERVSQQGQIPIDRVTLNIVPANVGGIGLGLLRYFFALFAKSLLRKRLFISLMAGLNTVQLCVSV